MASKEFDRPENERKVPIRTDLVTVTEGTGLKYAHVRTSGKVLELFGQVLERQPKAYWLDQFIKSWENEREPIGEGVPSHRYPTDEEWRGKAYEIGSIFKEIYLLTDDQIARDLLLIAACLCLDGGWMVDEQITEVVESTKNMVIPENELLRGVTLTELGVGRRAKYSEEAQKRAKSILRFTHQSAEIGVSHPIPETHEQKEAAIRLRELYDTWMSYAMYHEIRNYALAAAARSLQLGMIYTQSFEMIAETYSSAVNRDRGARYHDEGDDIPQRRDEDDEDLLPWGNIS